MVSTGCLPTHETFRFLVRGIHSCPTSDQLPWALRIISHVKKSRLSFDTTLLNMLVELFTDQGRTDDAAKVEKSYRTQGAGLASTVVKLERKYNDQLAEACRVDGTERALELLDTFRTRGFEPSHFTVLAMLGHSYRQEDLVLWEARLGVNSGPVVWSTMIRNALNARLPSSDRVSIALDLYKAAKARGKVGFLLAEPIVRALCSSTLTAPNEASLDQALVIYEDIKASRPSDSSDAQPTTTAQISLYNTLLRALAASSNKVKYFPRAIQVLQNMREDDLQGDGMTTASLTVLLMRSSSSFEEAFKVYQTIRTNPHVPLKAKFYSLVLHTFSELQFENRTVPPLDYYFHIVNDMRAAGYPLSVQVYTSVFRQIANLAGRIDHADPAQLEFRRALVTATRSAHHHLLVDASVTPDTPCLNQIMDTYQRAGSFIEARRVWDTLYLTGKADNTSISIIFDACGYAGAPRAAAEIYRKLREDGYTLNKNNWYAWLECLCRLGQLDEATRQVCMEMKTSPDGIAPDVECVRILVKFAHKDEAAREVLNRIQRFLPALWQNLPSSILRLP
ncbi:hypothetical protein BV25DRAFT_1818504 [Artomyces pyxidatus]|uniref:Uncharacterized protein n=1 Tax=Artomyces pyxidatus TaxID=48021 RepID=A0ACB8TI63_9AGAM|nr:hypothetical protein BV25DRAFT_1818504 [Artomyces pyxidatus]